MPEGTYRFPKGFLWGTATAAHQVEGQNENNNWSVWENEPGRVFQGQKAGTCLRLVERALERRPRKSGAGRAEFPPLLDRVEPYPTHTRHLE